MILCMRLANVVFIALFVAVGALKIFQFRHDLVPQIGMLVGYALWIVLFSFTLRGLAPRSGPAAVQIARIASSVALSILGLALMVGVILAEPGTPAMAYLPLAIPLAMLATPLCLNLLALGQRKRQLMPPAAVPNEITLPEKANYFTRHWRGDLSLGIAYWVNGGLLAGAASLLLDIFLFKIHEGDTSLRSLSIIILTVSLATLLVWIWSAVGVWRSAGRHGARGGARGWGYAARAVTVVGTLSMSAVLTTSTLPQMREYALLAIGQDPLGEVNITLSANGQTMIVDGVFRAGSAQEIENRLAAAPQVQALMLNSYGGRLLEARHLADTVRNRRLDTYVEGTCASACTVVFLAGRDRAAGNDAQIGFHQPSFVGLDDEAQRAHTERMLDMYRAAGLPEGFVQRIGQTPPQEMWYPDRSDLIAANVITRTSLTDTVVVMQMM